MHPSDREDIEVALFIEALRRRHGLDFSQYAAASFKRRVQALATQLHSRNISELTERALYEDGFISEVIPRLSIPVSDMFRDPDVFLTLRREVLPLLASYPRIRIWQAGCARGEEVYSLAILLQEEGLYDRSQIFATDFNEIVLAEAQEGVFPARDAKQYASNYLRAGGKASLHDYVHARYERIKLNEDLKRNITFANHNLVSDGVFGEMHLILCRNVLIYFNEELKIRVLRTLRDSLVRNGFLCLGTKESLRAEDVVKDFSVFSAPSKIFRRDLYGGG